MKLIRRFSFPSRLKTYNLQLERTTYHVERTTISPLLSRGPLKIALIRYQLKDVS